MYFHYWACVVIIVGKPYHSYPSSSLSLSIPLSLPLAFLPPSPSLPPSSLSLSLSLSQPPGSKNLTPDEARQIQLDIIYTLHKYKAPVTAGLDVDQEDILHPRPLHPSLMALGYECSFSEAAILIGK